MRSDEEGDKIAIMGCIVTAITLIAISFVMISVIACTAHIIVNYIWG